LDNHKVDFKAAKVVIFVQIKGLFEVDLPFGVWTYVYAKIMRDVTLISLRNCVKDGNGALPPIAFLIIIGIAIGGKREWTA